VLGIYVHFPYCRKHCPYCDFAVHARKEIPHQRYADAVARELAEAAPSYSGRTVGTLYFGGGTPSLWTAVGSVIDRVRREFPCDFREVTLEADPLDLVPERLTHWRALGIDRLSIGAQTFDETALVRIGRLHRPADVVQGVRAARNAGFANLSIDLMFGLPGQNLAMLDRDLDQLLQLSAEHVSLYGLTLEERTPFFRLHQAGQLAVPSSDEQADFFERICARLRGAGYEHYEISNFARPGYRAVHNRLYWTFGEVLGLGASAHSHRRVGEVSERFSNVRSVDDYFAHLGRESLHASPRASYEQRGPEECARDALWLGLRQLDGIERAAFRARFGRDPAEGEAVEKLVRLGLVEVTEERLRMTDKGVLLGDEVALTFV
jgi:oxygen-independent coproporphyrinogen-3 oxidase